MTTTATYRKTRQGEWVAFGPISIIKPGQVTITKRDGSTKVEMVESTGKSFPVDGVPCCYGYIAKPATHQPITRGSTCDECGRHTGYLVRAIDMSGIAGRVCSSCKQDEGSLSFC